MNIDINKMLGGRGGDVNVWSLTSVVVILFIKINLAFFFAHAFQSFSERIFRHSPMGVRINYDLEKGKKEKKGTK